MTRRPRAFSLLLALTGLLVTAVVAQEIWRSYYPPYGKLAFKERKRYYEEVLLRSNLSWKEGLYYKVIEEPERKGTR